MFAPSYQITPTLLRTLKQIAILVHDLNKRSPNQTVEMELLSEARAVSAYASTTIEGNALPLTAVKQLLKQTPKRLQQSEREVVNYNHALSRLENKFFSERLVLAIHKDVMNGLLVKEKCGAYRKEPVFVHNPRTGEVIFLPPDYQDVAALMCDLFAFINNHQDVDPVILAGLFHKQFVIIHPFIDGNGRTVRLATTVLLRDLGLNLFNLLSLENYYNNDISRYFTYVGEHGDYEDIKPDFTNWLEYFASGILDELLRLQKRLRYPRLSNFKSIIKRYWII